MWRGQGTGAWGAYGEGGQGNEGTGEKQEVEAKTKLPK